MRRFNRVTIIGVGLIGGSIGLGVKRKHLAREVVGVFRRNRTLRKALARGAVDRGTKSIKEGVKDADLIILATPVHLIPKMTGEVLKIAKQGAIITDVGSTKGWIVNKIEKMAGRGHPVFFVGSHPMAGSEQTSVEFSRDDLLDGSPCIVTKTKNTDLRAVAKVAGFWKALGAKVKIMSPEDHDKGVAMVSHLPHLVAFSLAGTVPVKDLAYAAEGFKDTTRVASSDPALWADIFLSNKKELLKCSRGFMKSYNALIKALSKNDYAKVVKLMTSAKARRDKFIYGKSS